MNTREVFKQNLNYFIHQSGKSKKEISEEIPIPYTTLIDWANGKKFPRADGIEKLANYFQIEKSSLLEEQSNDDIGFDDFTYAMHNESGKLTEEEKKMLLDMARMFNRDKNK